MQPQIPVPQRPALNPLLAKVKLPGRVFQLASRGLFYEPGVLAEHVKDGEVQVSPMSALAEMKLRSADLLYSGKVLRELCAECVPDILKPEALLTKDVDSLFVFLRVVTYGTKLTVSSVHSCDDAKLHEHEVNLEPLLSNPRNTLLDHRDTLYKISLSNGQVVRARPPTYEAAMMVVQLKQNIAKFEVEHKVIDDVMLEKVMMTDMLAVVEGVEVDDIVVTNQAHIMEWIKAVPRTLLSEILDGIKGTDQWGYEFKAKLRCKDCGAEYDHDLELDPINFFFG